MLDVVLPLKGQPGQQILASLLGSPWPKPCPGVSSSLQAQVAQPPARPTAPHVQQPAGTAGKLLLSYNLSEPLPSPPVRLRQPEWTLGGPDASSRAGAVRVQQYIGGRQGLQGVLNIHVTRPDASGRLSGGLPEAGTRGRQLYCLLQELPWALQLEPDGLRLDVQLKVWWMCAASLPCKSAVGACLSSIMGNAVCDNSSCCGTYSMHKRPGAALARCPALGERHPQDAHSSCICCVKTHCNRAPSDVGPQPIW